MLMNAQLLELKIGVSTSYILQVPMGMLSKLSLFFLLYLPIFFMVSYVHSLIERVLTKYNLYILPLVTFSFSSFYLLRILIFPYLIFSVKLIYCIVKQLSPSKNTEAYTEICSEDRN